MRRVNRQRSVMSLETNDSYYRKPQIMDTHQIGVRSFISSLSGWCWKHRTADAPSFGTPCSQHQPLCGLNQLRGGFPVNWGTYIGLSTKKMDSSTGMICLLNQIQHKN